MTKIRKVMVRVQKWLRSICWMCTYVWHACKCQFDSLEMSCTLGPIWWWVLLWLHFVADGGCQSVKCRQSQAENLSKRSVNFVCMYVSNRNVCIYVHCKRINWTELYLHLLLIISIWFVFLWGFLIAFVRAYRYVYFCNTKKQDHSLYICTYVFAHSSLSLSLSFSHTPLSVSTEANCWLTWRKKWMFNLKFK